MPGEESPLVPFVPSPLPVVRKMLELAGAGAGDVVYDLGCGDGRIPITAVEQFGVSEAYCVEIRRDLADKARLEVERRGLQGRVHVINQDMFKLDLSGATIVTLFLLTSVNDMLAPKLERELRDGTRVVSHEFRVTRWNPIIHATLRDKHVSHELYLYIKPFSIGHSSV